MQLSRHDELFGQLSSLVAAKALDDVQGRAFLTFERYFLEVLKKSGSRLATKTAADIAVKLTDSLYRPIMEQFDPMKVGEHARSTEVAFQYGARLNDKFNNLPQNALNELIYGYPSHGFVIDINETARLFNRVELFDDKLNALLRQSKKLKQDNGNIFFIDEDRDETSNKQEAPSVSGSEQLERESDQGRSSEGQRLRQVSPKKSRKSGRNLPRIITTNGPLKKQRGE